MLEVEKLDSAVVEMKVAEPKRRSKLWVVTLGVVAISGAFYYKFTHGPRDASNYSILVPTLIPGFHPGHRGMMSSFVFDSDNKDAQIKGGGFRLVSSIRPTGDYDTEDMANLLKQSAQMPGWTPAGVEPDIDVDGLAFKVLRRSAPTSTMLSAVSVRGNDTYEITLVVNGPRDKQEAALQTYRPVFKHFLQDIRFAQLPMVPDL